MNIALSKLPIFGFALSLEKWRWDFFGDKIKDGKINKRWWERKFVSCTIYVIKNLKASYIMIMYTLVIQTICFITHKFKHFNILRIESLTWKPIKELSF